MASVHRNRANRDWPRVSPMRAPERRFGSEPAPESEALLAWKVFDPADVPMASPFHA